MSQKTKAQQNQEQKQKQFKNEQNVQNKKDAVNATEQRILKEKLINQQKIPQNNNLQISDNHYNKASVLQSHKQYIEGLQEISEEPSKENLIYSSPSEQQQQQLSKNFSENSSQNNPYQSLLQQQQEILATNQRDFNFDNNNNFNKQTQQQQQKSLQQQKQPQYLQSQQQQQLQQQQQQPHQEKTSNSKNQHNNTNNNNYNQGNFQMNNNNNSNNSELEQLQNLHQQQEQQQSQQSSVMGQQQQQQQQLQRQSISSLKESMHQIFKFYASFGDRCNTEFLKSNKFHKMMVDAQLQNSDPELSAQNLDLLFVKVNKHRCNMDFETFLVLLGRVAEKKHQNLKPSAALNRVLEENMLPLFNSIMTQTDLGDDEELLREEIELQSLQMLRKAQPVLLKMYNTYFHVERISQGKSKKEEQIKKMLKQQSQSALFFFLKEFEICPALITKSTVYLLYSEIVQTSIEMLCQSEKNIVTDFIQQDSGYLFTFTRFCVYLVRLAGFVYQGLVESIQKQQQDNNEINQLQQPEKLSLLFERMELSQGYVKLENKISSILGLNNNSAQQQVRRIDAFMQNNNQGQQQQYQEDSKDQNEEFNNVNGTSDDQQQPLVSINNNILIKCGNINNQLQLPNSLRSGSDDQQQLSRQFQQQVNIQDGSVVINNTIQSFRLNNMKYYKNINELNQIDPATMQVFDTNADLLYSIYQFYTQNQSQSNISLLKIFQYNKFLRDCGILQDVTASRHNQYKLFKQNPQFSLQQEKPNNHNNNNTNSKNNNNEQKSAEQQSQQQQQQQLDNISEQKYSTSSNQGDILIQKLIQQDADIIFIKTAKSSLQQNQDNSHYNHQGSNNTENNNIFSSGVKGSGNKQQQQQQHGYNHQQFQKYNKPNSLNFEQFLKALEQIIVKLFIGNQISLDNAASFFLENYLTQLMEKLTLQQQQQQQQIMSQFQQQNQHQQHNNQNGITPAQQGGIMTSIMMQGSDYYIKLLLTILKDQEVVDLLGMFHKSVLIYFQHYADSKGWISFEQFLKFAKDFSIFPDIVQKQKLIKIYQALSQIVQSNNESTLNEEEGDSNSKNLRQHQLQSQSEIVVDMLDQHLFVEAIALCSFEIQYSDPEPSNFEKIYFLIERMNQAEGLVTIQKQICTSKYYPNQAFDMLFQIRKKYEKKMHQTYNQDSQDYQVNTFEEMIRQQYDNQEDSKQ